MRRNNRRPISSRAMATSNSTLIRRYRPRLRKNRPLLRRFITRLQKTPPRGIDATISALIPGVWKDVKCLSCANCCKTMSPTYLPADMRRISKYLGMTVNAFKDKYLEQERGAARDWMNRSTPCQFLRLSDNKCRIYSVRPLDCSTFPHLGVRFADYGHVHHQNVEYCPATYELMSRLKEVTETIG